MREERDRHGSMYSLAKSARRGYNWDKFEKGKGFAPLFLGRERKYANKKAYLAVIYKANHP